MLLVLRLIIRYWRTVLSVCVYFWSVSVKLTHLFKVVKTEAISLAGYETNDGYYT
uniref:Uncharacterized protein n=1 Tax=Anguilla anguilla TaxID=7936 RepID=A0A0E9WQ16_ANGAN